MAQLRNILNCERDLDCQWLRIFKLSTSSRYPTTILQPAVVRKIETLSTVQWMALCIELSIEQSVRTITRIWQKQHICPMGIINLDGVYLSRYSHIYIYHKFSGPSKFIELWLADSIINLHLFITNSSLSGEIYNEALIDNDNFNALVLLFSIDEFSSF